MQTDVVVADDAKARVTERDAQTWAQLLARYREPNVPRSVVEIAITAGPLLAILVVSYLLTGFSYWLALPLALPGALFLVRLFLIQHDCGHGSFFRNPHANTWVGRVCGVFTLTPFGVWRISHNMHHMTSGNLERRGIGDIETMTVAEYLAAPWYERLRYRLYRNPIVLFVIGPAYVFLIANRLPVGFMTKGWRPWVSTMANNAVIASLVVLFIWLIGIGPFLVVYLPMILLAASIGVWLFFVQHQFDETVWATDEDWNLQHAALKGSSHYDLPAVLRWFTANIGVHHVHHLSSRIPYYRLGHVLRDHPELKDVGRLTLWQSLRCARLALWCETRRRMVSFRELRLA